MSHNLSPRIKWLRDYYFRGTGRAWNNEQISFSTGTEWDVQYNELNYYIVPETYPFFQTFRSSYRQTARPVDLCADFWNLSIPERRAWFNRKVMTTYMPCEILPGDLIAGGRFNMHTSLCLSRKEQRERDRAVMGARGLRKAVIDFHNSGFGNCGPTGGHLIPDYPAIIRHGFIPLIENLEELHAALSPAEQKGARGAQLRAMISAARMPLEVADRYRREALRLAEECQDLERKKELLDMAGNLEQVPARGARNFWEAVQSLWLTHMLVMSDENYPGPGVSFGRIDQYLLPFWENSVRDGMSREFAAEILGCFWVHANTAYDSMIKVGNQGITAGFGQLFNLSGLGPEGRDMTNDLTWLFLEVIDGMSPILEPKPNVRIHRGSPDALLDRLVDMVMRSDGAPFLLNFDERSMAGMMRESRRSGKEGLINEHNVHDYASVGCLENTMCGNDRSGTVDCNLNLLKAVELVLGNGMPLVPFTDPITGAQSKLRRQGPASGDPRGFTSFERFMEAWEVQTEALLKRMVRQYERGEALRASFHPTPYLSTLVRGCAEKGKDITGGGAELSFVTIEGVTFASTVDSLLAVRYLVFDNSFCTMEELIEAVRSDWKGFEQLRVRAKNKAPKYGRDDDAADALGTRVMQFWSEACWKYRTASTERQFRPGMLSWNYWVGDGFILPASPDGRRKNSFLSNAICPSDGADIHGPTANSNSVGTVLGGREGEGDWLDYRNVLPNGASHTISFNPSMFGREESREKFKSFLRGYAENGGTALQINMLDPKTLMEAQKRPADFRHLLVRVTGYNAYFTAIGKELQDELIARISHERI